MRSALLTLLAALALGTAPLTEAHTYTPTHYAAPCSSGNGNYNAYFHVVRPYNFAGEDESTWGTFKFVRAQATITDLDPCTNATTTAKGWAMVNVVNAEVFKYKYAFVQFGYAQAACVSGDCQGGFSPYVTDFWWTDSDQSNGTITRADWVDFDNDGSHDRPQLHDRYQFTIQWVTSPATWSFCVKIISSTTYTAGATDCQTISRTTAGPINRATRGAETHNDASAMGATTGDDIDLSPMQYMNVNGSVYTTVTNAYCWRIRLDSANVPWASQHCDITGGTGTSHLDAWTAAHT